MATFTNSSSNSSPDLSNTRSEFGNYKKSQNIISRLWHATSQELRHAFIQKKEQNSSTSSTPTPIPAPISRPELCFEALLEAEEYQLEQVDYAQRNAKMAWVIDQQWPVSDPDALLEEYLNRTRETTLQKVKRRLTPDKRHRFADRYEKFEEAKGFGRVKGMAGKAVKKTVPAALRRKFKKETGDNFGEIFESKVGPWDSISMRGD